MAVILSKFLCDSSADRPLWSVVSRCFPAVLFFIVMVVCVFLASILQGRRKPARAPGQTFPGGKLGRLKTV